MARSFDVMTDTLEYELGHDPILEQVLLSRLRPALLNDQVYRPVDPRCPEVELLAESIRTHGLLEPLVVTLDDVILSGHRRRVACKLAGLKTVPVRRECIYSDDERFPTLLVEYNRQRVKTF